MCRDSYSGHISSILSKILFLVLSKNGNNSRNFAIFASGFDKTNRDVAQLVAHYVRDVGVGRSSRLIPTCKRPRAFTARGRPFIACLICNHGRGFLKAVACISKNGRGFYPFFLTKCQFSKKKFTSLLAIAAIAVIPKTVVMATKNSL